MTDFEKMKPILLWLAICTFLAGVPAIIIYSTVSRHLFLAEEQYQQEIKDAFNQATVQARLNVDQEVFWCRFFHQNYIKFSAGNVPAEKVEKWIARVRESFNNEFDYLCWDIEGNTIKRTFPTKFSEQDWKEVFKTLSHNFSFGNRISYSRSYEPNIAVTKKVLGDQYIPELFGFNFDSKLYSLAWPDSTMQRPLYFNFFLNDCAYLIAIKEEKLQLFTGLRIYIESYALTRKLKMGIFSPANSADKIWKTYQSSEEDDKSLEPLLNNCEKNSITFMETGNSFICYQFLAPKLRLFLRSPRMHSHNEITFYSFLGAFLFLILMLPVFRHTWRTIVLGLPGNVSIRFKLAFLFLFASGIPLMALAIISQENYSQKRLELMNKAQIDTTEFITSFDKRFSTFIAGICHDMKEYFKAFGEKAKEKMPADILCDDAMKHMKIKYVNEFFIVSSSTNSIISRSGFYNYKGSLEGAEIDLANSKPSRTFTQVVKGDLITANLVGKKVLSDLNNTPFSVSTISKLEIIAESITQRPFIEIVHSIISSFGTLGVWGFGRIKDYAYSNLVSTHDTNVYDFIALIFWRPYFLQTHFLEAKLAEAARNNQGMKIVAVRIVDECILPEGITTQPELLAFARVLSKRPNEDIQLLNFDGKPHIAVGFKAKELDTYKLIGLHPLDEIERTIQLQRLELLLFGIFCILFSIGLAQILFRSFLKPIDALKSGALAIELRNFDHRIAIQNKDEFGQIAEIFNNVMVGFQELEVAKFVQESLFPKPAFSHGNFNVYGKSLTMSELGGDYFDYITIDDQKFAILMGDVAGHGVGAAVIMAMAKAGILSSSDKLCEPAELMLRLHKMILASKSEKQRKVMTFQYLFLNNSSDSGLYSNAGGCSPMLITSHGEEVQEVTLAGPALGAFKRAKYQNSELSFSHGDAIVFYTDGIVETRNPEGNEIGYAGFKKILSESWDMNPEIFYNNVLSRYEKHLDGQEAQDDITFLIMVCDHAKETAEAKA